MRNTHSHRHAKPLDVVLVWLGYVGGGIFLAMNNLIEMRSFIATANGASGFVVALLIVVYIKGNWYENDAGQGGERSDLGERRNPPPT